MQLSLVLCVGFRKANIDLLFKGIALNVKVVAIHIKNDLIMGTTRMIGPSVTQMFNQDSSKMDTYHWTTLMLMSHKKIRWQQT